MVTLYYSHEHYIISTDPGQPLASSIGWDGSTVSWYIDVDTQLTSYKKIIAKVVEYIGLPGQGVEERTQVYTSKGMLTILGSVSIILFNLLGVFPM